MKLIPVILPIAVIATLSATEAFATTGNQEFSAEIGKQLWNQTHNISGQSRSCTSCHTENPAQPGKHIRTGKPIKPMAPSVNLKRFTDNKKTAKWFKRNCKWTWGRECSDQEKADITRYLKSL